VLPELAGITRLTELSSPLSTGMDNVGSTPVYTPCPDQLRKNILNESIVWDEGDDFYTLWEAYDIDLVGDYFQDSIERGLQTGVQTYTKTLDVKTILRIDDEATMLKLTQYMKREGQIESKLCTHLRCTWKKHYCPEKVRAASNQHQQQVMIKNSTLGSYESLKAKQDREREIYKRKQRATLDKLYKQRSNLQKSVETNEKLVKLHSVRAEKARNDVHIIEREIAELEEDIRDTSPPKKRAREEEEEAVTEEHQVGGGVDQGELDDYEEEEEES